MQIKKSYVILGVVALVLIVLVGSCVGIRNGIVTADQATKKAWGNVEVAYQYRFDLVPSLVSTVKAYAKHESSTLQNVTDARVGRVDAAGEELQTLANDTEAELSNPNLSQEQRQQALSKFQGQYGVYINAVHEAYPDLKASENFMDLQNQLSGIESRIKKSREDYNKAVDEYNNKILRFPGSLFGWGYSEKQYFNSDAGASRRVDVGEMFED